jgi:gluconolactonase
MHRLILAVAAFANRAVAAFAKNAGSSRRPAFLANAATGLLLLLILRGSAGEEKIDLSSTPLPAGLVAPQAKATAAALVCFLEGPAVDDKGNVFFSDIISNRILKMNASGAISVFRADSGRSNGNAFDAQGRLISCEGFGLGPGGRRRIVRTDMKTGDITVVTDRYEGKRYNSPNDVCVDDKGRIWFTDPRYGDREDMEMKDEAVYRIDPDGQVARVLSQPDVEKPNGIAIAPDGRTLYVIDSNDSVGGNRKIWALDVSEKGELSKRRRIYDFRQGRGGDGVRVDMKGNLWVAAGIRTPRPPGEVTDIPQGVYVISPQGKLLGRVPIPEDYVTNLAFGGPDRKTLYVLAGTSVYKIPVAVSGYAVYPPLRQ